VGHLALTDQLVIGPQRYQAECARLLSLGAAPVQLLLADEHNESCLVMRDVEGNEFCLD